MHADDVHEVQDNQGFITYHISVTWSLSDKNDLTDICRIIFMQLLSDKIHHKKRSHKLFSESSWQQGREQQDRYTTGNLKDNLQNLL